MEEHLYDDFGSGEAANDVARSMSALDDVFVETPAIRSFLERETDIPFIVGSKGTGKSLLLFKKAVLARRNAGVLVFPRPPQKSFAPTADFASSVQWAPIWDLLDSGGSPMIEGWTSLWEWALLHTILVNAHEYGYGLKDKPEWFRSLHALVDGLDNDDPFNWVSSFMRQLETGEKRVMGKTAFPDPTPLRRCLVKNVDQMPPMYFFIDHQDDFFDQHPQFWLASNHGCFLAIQKIRSITNHRIHIFMTLRPEVHWAIQDTQDFSKWDNDFFPLTWAEEHLIRLLSVRIQRLRKLHLKKPEVVNDDPLMAFFGQEFYDSKRHECVIENLAVNATGEKAEILGKYLLRHTLQRPRDIINVGNEILRQRLAGTQGNDSSLVRDAVHHAATRAVAIPYLREVANRWPWGKDDPVASIRQLVAHFPCNVMTRRETDAIRKRFAKENNTSEDPAHPFCKLAAFGLIGWPIQDRNRPGCYLQSFLVPGQQKEVCIPEQAQWFFVHPVLCGEPFDVGGKEGVVVGPGLPFDPSKVK